METKTLKDGKQQRNWRLQVVSRFGFVFLAALCLASCGGAEQSVSADLGAILGTGKSDVLNIEQVVPELGPKSDYSVTFRTSAAFKVVLLTPDRQAYARLRLRWDGGVVETQTVDEPELARPGTESEVSYTLTVLNRSSMDKYNLVGAKLLITSTETPEEPIGDDEPKIQVRFTEPQCAAVEGKAPAGVHCYATNAEKDASREKAGIVDHANLWINAATEYKKANPDKPVRITMAFLSWSDTRWYDALCNAAKSGVIVDGFFDRQTAGNLAPKLDADSNCMQQKDGQLVDNVTISYLGGRTDLSASDWRLMHIKMVLIDTGEKMHKLIFGSANVSTYATTIAFENWVFAEFPRESHFVKSHYCAVDALRGDLYESAYSNTYGNKFSEIYRRCVEQIDVEPDPRYQVFFTPDPNTGALNALVSAMDNAKTSVDMAIQHFNDSRLARQLALNGQNSNVKTRLILDDDTYYGNGEVSSSDHSTYSYTLKNAGIDIRFIQTNGHMQYGMQYQHNKYVVIDDQLVFMGAGNFTTAAFGIAFSANSHWEANYENFYLLNDAKVAAQYKAHYEKLFSLGRSADELPADSKF